MSRLDAARRWYESELEVLAAIRAWMRTREEVPRTLRPLVRGYYDKKDAPERLRTVRTELERTALVRMFSGFEADFRPAFSAWLKASFDRAHPSHVSLRLASAIDEALPESVKGCMDLFCAVEPRLSLSDKNWFHGLRQYRNMVMHEGFADAPVKEDPQDAYTSLRRILDALTIIP